MARQVAGRRGKRHVDPAARTLCREPGCARHGHDHRCSLEECDQRRNHRDTGYCRGHYRAWLRTGDPLSRRKYVRSDGRCKWPGCKKKHRRNGFCVNHSAVHYRMLAATLAFPATPRVPAAPLVEHLEGLRRRGWSATDIAKQIGCHPSNVQRWLAHEERDLNRATAEDVCDALGLHPAMLWDDWVVCGHGRKECDRCGFREYAA